MLLLYLLQPPGDTGLEVCVPLQAAAVAAADGAAPLARLTFNIRSCALNGGLRMVQGLQLEEEMKNPSH